jgi:hypothetical protein
MMKQILLCVTPIFAKICLREFAKLQGRHPFLSRKILLLQGPLDPDVDWERAQTLKGEQHYTVGNLRSHAGQST